MPADIEQALGMFRPLSLDDLNARAEMLERLDNKYIIGVRPLRRALGAFARHFDVLEIGARRTFTYATRYYDDPDLHGYHDHHQGRRKRCKVRVRDYVDAGLRFLEVKLKDKRQVTVKKRLRLGVATGIDSAEARAFVEASYRDLYDEPFDRPLAPVIDMHYRRVTLVAREGGERMTIDTGLTYLTDGRIRSVDRGLFIIETKSERANGIADKILRALHVHPTERCSKYCVGMAALGCVERRNRFLPALRRLNLVDGDDQALS